MSSEIPLTKNRENYLCTEQYEYVEYVDYS